MFEIRFKYKTYKIIIIIIIILCFIFKTYLQHVSIHNGLSSGRITSSNMYKIWNKIKISLSLKLELIFFLNENSYLEFHKSRSGCVKIVE